MNPTKQGLKLGALKTIVACDGVLAHESNKTRIETFCFCNIMGSCLGS